MGTQKADKIPRRAHHSAAQPPARRSSQPAGAAKPGDMARRSLAAASSGLKVGAVDAAAEREADNVAERLSGGRPTPFPDSGNGPGPSDEAASGEAFTAPADVAHGISQARGGGRPLPSQLARSFGEELGTDLSGVRVHTGAEAEGLSHELSATAFTLGNDIFFARRAYQPESEQGRRLLAHEVAHTVQQGDATHRVAEVQRAPVVQRERLRPGKKMRDGRSAVMVSTRPRAKTTKTSTRNGTSTTQDVFSVKGGSKWRPGTQIEVDPGSEVADPKGVRYVKVTKKRGPTGRGTYTMQSTQDNTWIKSSALGGSGLDMSGINAFLATTTQDKLGDQVDEAEDDAGPNDFLDIGSTIANTDNFQYNNDYTGANDSVSGAGSAMGGDVLGELSGFEGMFEFAQKVKKWRELGGWDRADAVVNLVGGLGSMAATGADFGNEGELLSKAHEATQVQQDAGTWGAGVAGGFIGAATGLWTAFRSWWDVVSTARKKRASDVVKGVGGALRDTLNFGKELMDTIRQVLDAMQHSLGHLLQAIPAVGLVASGLKIALRGWDWFRSGFAFSSIRAEKQAVKLLLGGRAGRTLKGNKPTPGTIDMNQTVKDRLAALGGSVRGQLKWLNNFGDLTLKEFAGELAGVDDTAMSEQEAIDVLWGRYDDQRFHQGNSGKEWRRAGIEIAQEVVTVAGEIATLTGVGAVGGAVTKGVAAGWKSLTTGVRWLKQTIRDAADKGQRKKVEKARQRGQTVNPTHFSFKHFFKRGESSMRPGFDPKSTQAKSQRYAEKGIGLLKQIAEVKTDLQMHMVVKTLKNLDVDTRALKRSPDVKSALNILVTAFRRR